MVDAFFLSCTCLEHIFSFAYAYHLKLNPVDENLCINVLRNEALQTCLVLGMQNVSRIFLSEICGKCEGSVKAQH